MREKISNERPDIDGNARGSQVNRHVLSVPCFVSKTRWNAQRVLCVCHRRANEIGNFGLKNLFVNESRRIDGWTATWQITYRCCNQTRAYYLHVMFEKWYIIDSLRYFEIMLRWFVIWASRLLRYYDLLFCIRVSNFSANFQIDFMVFICYSVSVFCFRIKNCL